MLLLNWIQTSGSEFCSVSGEGRVVSPWCSYPDPIHFRPKEAITCILYPNSDCIEAISTYSIPDKPWNKFNIHARSENSP